MGTLQQRTGGRWGQWSMVVGGIGIALALLWRRFDLVLSEGRGIMLNFLSRLGAVDTSTIHPAEMRAIHLFSIDDQIALEVLMLAATGAGICSLLLFLVAESRREITLYLSAGFICGIGALWLMHPNSALALLLTLGTAVLVSRGRRAG